MKKLAILFCITGVFGLFCNLFLNKPSFAADFSQTQRIYVPSSLIHRDLDAMGVNNLNLPNTSAGANSLGNNSAGISNTSNNPIDALMSNYGAGGVSSGFNSNAAYGNSQTNMLTTGSRYTPGVNGIVSQINYLLNNGKVAEAENLTRDGLKYYPNSSILKSKFTAITSSEAQTFFAAGYYDLAGKKAREALACNSNAKTAKSIDSKVLQTQGLNPSAPEGHVRAADNLSADGRLLEASVEYKLALNIRPNAPAHVGLGNLALGKGSLIDAGRHYEQALAIDPQSELAYRQRGALRYVMHDPVAAHSDFSKAVALCPDDRLASDALVSLWKQQVANNPSINSHLGLARAYMQTNNLEAAKGEYKTVAGLDPTNPALPEARRSYKSALARQQANQNVQAAKTLEMQGAYNEAQQKLNEALALDPSNSQILLVSGHLSKKMGLYQQAHDSYMAVLKVDPKNIEAAHGLKELNTKISQSPSMPGTVANQAPPPALLRLIRPGSNIPPTNNSLPATNFASSNFASPNNSPVPTSTGFVDSATFSQPVNFQSQTGFTPPANFQPPAGFMPPTNFSPPTNFQSPTGSAPPVTFSPPTNFQSPVGSSFPAAFPSSATFSPSAGALPPAGFPSSTAPLTTPSPLPSPSTNDILNVPLKSPLQPKSKITVPNSFYYAKSPDSPANNGVCDNSYLRTTDNVYLQPHLYIGNYIPTNNTDITENSNPQFSLLDSSDPVNSLANFAYALRALMLVEKQALQLSSTARNNF